VAFGNDSGSKRLRGAKGQFVRQAGLSHQDDRQPRFGIFFKLADGVKFCKDFQAHQGGFIDDENHFPKKCRKLSGWERSYRIRSGRYRIVYSILSDELAIEIQRIGHRKDITKI
jgi:mRNA-degrading endonuclease RelE of RelBE toxin-antitoxin system